jgi:hypothetical protein
MTWGFNLVQMMAPGYKIKKVFFTLKIPFQFAYYRALAFHWTKQLNF